MELGGTVVSLRTPDRDGALADIVLGHDTLEPYVGREQSPYFGAIIGRFGNRIAGGKFSLDGQDYTPALNNCPNTLHGGEQGFDQRVWEGRIVEDADGAAVEFACTSPDGGEGYPGALAVTVRYTLTDADEPRIDYTATTDAPTAVNLTNRSYWNLSGDASRNGLCLETQHCPDAPNQPDFPSTRLDPGQTCQSTTVHRFHVEEA